MKKLHKLNIRKARDFRTPRQLARENALQAIYQSLISGAERAEIEKNILELNIENKINPELTLFHTLFYGTIEKQNELTKIIKEYSNRDNHEVSPIVQAILLLATFELVHQLQTPAPVILNEAIEIAKRYASDEAFKYVNGVLQKITNIYRKSESKAKN